MSEVYRQRTANLIGKLCTLKETSEGLEVQLYQLRSEQLMRRAPETMREPVWDMIQAMTRIRMELARMSAKTTTLLELLT